MLIINCLFFICFVLNNEKIYRNLFSKVIIYSSLLDIMTLSNDPKLVRKILPHKPYALTIKPNNKAQFFGLQSREAKFDKLISDFLINNQIQGMKYLLFTELSEPLTPNADSNGPRLHLHGFIFFEDNRSIKQFLMRYSYLMLAQLGTYELDTVNDIDYFLQYCQKQQPYLKLKIHCNYVEPKGFIKDLRNL